jgi:hypothetical protein
VEIHESQGPEKSVIWYLLSIIPSFLGWCCDRQSLPNSAKFDFYEPMITKWTCSWSFTLLLPFYWKTSGESILSFVDNFDKEQQSNDKLLCCHASKYDPNGEIPHSLLSTYMTSKPRWAVVAGGYFKSMYTLGSHC